MNSLLALPPLLPPLRPALGWPGPPAVPPGLRNQCPQGYVQVLDAVLIPWSMKGYA
jgi:hypothetical protein